MASGRKEKRDDEIHTAVLRAIILCLIGRRQLAGP
jgi:hypothetical protein